ncbi:MAG: DMT family transporter [Polyangiaceae bacterium]
MTLRREAARDRLRAASIMVLCAILWSTGGLGVKLSDTSALSISGYRSFFALLVMGADTLYRARRAKVSPFSTIREPIVWGAAVSYCVMVISFVASAKMTTAANAIFIQYTGTVYVALLSWPVLREKLSIWDFLAIGCCIRGLLWFFGGELDPHGFQGNMIAVVSSVGFAGLPVLLKLGERKLTSKGRAAEVPVMTILAMSLGNALTIVVCSRTMMLSPPPHEKAWFTIAMLGIFQIGAPYILYGIAVQKLRALESTVIATIEPIMTPIWVLAVTGERPSRAAIYGGSLVALAVLLQAFGSSRARPQKAGAVPNKST